MSRLTNIAIWCGGGALLAATAIDTLAVIGRHIGLPLTGSIELIQAAVLVSASLGIVLATLAQSHARVRLLVDRLNTRHRAWADRFADALTFVFFIALLTGSVWLSIDLFQAHEHSEIMGVPWRVLRLFANLCLLGGCMYLLVRIFAKVAK